jgi:transposase-like protein
MLNNLRELIVTMPDETTCRNYLIQQRRNGDIVCPYCGFSKVYVIENGKRFKCSDRANCAKKFSVTIGTIMEASNIVGGKIGNKQRK